MKACMVAFTYYEVDNRVRRYAEALYKEGWQVDAIVLKMFDKKTRGIINGINLYRIQKRAQNEKGKILYLFRLLKFYFLSSLVLIKNSFPKKYDLIHVHSVPDFEVFATLLPKIFGSKIILDIHDPVPDFFALKFGNNKNTFFITTLKLIERVSTFYAEHVISVTDYWKDIIRCRSHIPEQKITVIVNFPDTSIFDIQKYPAKSNNNKPFTLLYPGTINKHCGLDIAIQAVKYVKEETQLFKFDIYGVGSEYENIVQMVKTLHLENTVFFHDLIPLESVPELMQKADAGIALLAGNNIYAQQALNVKLFEFLAMGLPAIATQTNSTEYYLSESTVMFSKMNDPIDVARCIKELIQNKAKRESLSKNGLEYIKQNNWNINKYDYFKIVDNLIGSNKK